MLKSRIKQITLIIMLFCMHLSVLSNIDFSEHLFSKIAKNYDKKAELRVRSWQTWTSPSLIDKDRL
jgi:hypothetical protein